MEKHPRIDAKMEQQAVTDKLTRNQIQNRKGREKLRARTLASKGEKGLQEFSERKRLISDLKTEIETAKMTYVRTDGRLAAVKCEIKENDMLDLQKDHEMETLNSRIKQIEFELLQHSKLHAMQDKSILELWRNPNTDRT